MKELAYRTTEDGDTWLTVPVPRRTYSNPLGKLLHRGTGETAPEERRRHRPA